MKKLIVLSLCLLCGANSRAGIGQSKLHQEGEAPALTDVQLLEKLYAAIDSNDPNAVNDALVAMERQGRIRQLINRALLNPETGEEIEGAALHFAAQKGYNKIVDVLLDWGADINSDRWGTVLHLAADHGNSLTVLGSAIEHHCADSTIKMLLDNGANPWKVSTSSWKASHSSWKASTNAHTALFCAACWGNEDAARILLSWFIDPVTRTQFVNAKDRYGMTALHMAAYKGFCGIIAMLLDAGADIHALIRRGQTPLQLAQQEGRIAAANLLIARGALH